MRAFLSSVISGYEDFRDAAEAALEDLDHTALRAERDFAASPISPRVACLDGVRKSDFVVLLLGARYGAVQADGLSATHEEFREAKGRKQLFVLVQSGVTPEAQQVEFIKEAQDWAAGHYTASFRDTNQLRSALTKAVSRWQLANAAGPADPGDAAQRAVTLIPPDRSRNYSGRKPTLIVSLAGTPRQQILRPSEYEEPTFSKSLIKELAFGDRAIFDHTAGSTAEVVEHGLKIVQKDRHFLISEDLSLLVALPIPKGEGGFFSSIIEEEVRATMEAGLRFAELALQKFDPTERISTVALATTITATEGASWVTRRQHDQQARQGSATMRMHSEEIKPVTLRPPTCTRAALRMETGNLAQDLMVTLRRQFRD